MKTKRTKSKSVRPKGTEVEIKINPKEAHSLIPLLIRARGL